MCANATPAASTTTPSTTSTTFASTGRSLLSRLTNPLKSRARNLTEFHIRPSEPHRQYSPGDLVTGAVVLTVIKPVRITHITVCLHGTVRVFKNPNDANEPVVVDPELAAAGNPRKTQYFGNGHASLFNDEQTLCGEGRLEAGIYEFNFELEFPKKGLPTSIDFERGTISYLITATITRPTSIAATSSCDQKINLVETVDIGPMVAPKPRVISLEPIARRPKRQRTAKGKESSPKESNDPSSGSEARAASSPKPEEGSQCDSVDHTANPRSPTPSEVHSVHSAATSADSTVSSSTGLSFRLGPVPSSARSATGSQGNSSKASLSEKTITATIECLRAGCLPGDNIPLKISIKHSKAMKSMHGIIITLYRQGRIDSAPPLSLFKDIKGKQAERLKHEEYYPKSKTGLGGLSLTSAGSSSMFRKDLAQTFAPILVDPISLTAVINASVRVPEDAFPTISGVPGQMITFKYMVEVVVDLGGKLAGQRSHVPRVGAVTPFGAASTNSRGDSNSNMLATWGGSIVDTDHIRREKSVVACLFEIVVGSTDSARRRGRGNSSVTKQSNDLPMEFSNSTARNEATHEEIFAPMEPVAEHVDNQNPYPYYEHPYEEEYPAYYHRPQYDYNRDHSYAQQAQVPPPDFQEDTLDEKERLRRAEERLLPSQPPPDQEQASSSRAAVAPSAPSAHPLESVDDLYDDETDTPFAGPSAPPFSNHDHDVDTPTAPPQGPSAPPLEDLHPSSVNHSTDDKQELERRRLLTEASAPVEFTPDEEDNAGEGSSRSPEQNHAPSAPVLDDEDDYGLRYAHGSISGPSMPVDEHLPRYER